MYHLILLLAAASELELVLLARMQWRANRLETCLVTGPDRAWFISADGRDALARTPPRGGTLVTGLLEAARLWPDTAERQARQRRLDALVEAHRRKGGYLLGDPTKGGREATADEVGRLAGAGPEGRPRGLERCPHVRRVARALSRPVPDLRRQGHDGALRLPERQSLRGVRRVPLRTQAQRELLQRQRWPDLARARLLRLQAPVPRTDQ
jgi:hypothetical protein